MKITLLLIAGILLMVVSCASDSGIVKISKDTYFISKQAATGFSGLSDLKVEAIREANVFCDKENKEVSINKTNETKPPYIFGNYPRVEIEFNCVNTIK